MKIIKSKNLFLTAVLVIGVSTQTRAAEDFNTWQHKLAPLYLWGVSLDGTMNGQALDIEFSDAVSDLEGIFTFHYEGAKSHWGVLLDYSFLNLGPSGTLPPGTPVDVDFTNIISEAAALYRFGPNNPWELLGGVRYYKIDVDVSVGPGINFNESITDVIVGGRYNGKLSDKWTLLARADVGTGDSDLTWNALLAFDYRFSELLSGFVGYRALDYDVDEPNFKYDMNHSGPALALAFHW